MPDWFAVSRRADQTHKVRRGVLSASGPPTQN